MANETTVQTSCIQEDHDSDECLENIPPGVAAAAGTPRVKVQGGDVAGCYSTQPSGGNEPLSDTCTFSTPAPTSRNGGVKAKSRLSGLQSALTPILKYLNIGNKCASPEPLKHGKGPHPNSGRSFGDRNAPVCLLDDECLPEITLLDVTCDSTMQLTKNDSVLPDSVPASPVIAGSLNSTFTTLQPQLSVNTDLNTAAQTHNPQNKMLDLLQSNVNSLKTADECTDEASSVQSLQKSSENTISGEVSATVFCLQNNTFDTKSSSKKNDTITMPETSSSDSDQNTLDKPSALRAKENNPQLHSPVLSKHNETTGSRDFDAKMVDTPERIEAPMRWLDDRLFPEITLLDVTRDSELSPGGDISCMDLTQDIPAVGSLQNNMPSPELRGPIVSEPGTSDVTESEELSGTLDGNVTHTGSSISEQFDKCAGENVMKATLEGTRDISIGSVLEDSRPSLEPSEQNMVKIQTSAEDTLGTLPTNVTHDINASGDMSAQCASSQFSTSDVQSNNSSKTVTAEPHSEPMVISDAVEATKEELCTSHDTELTSKVSRPSPETAGSVNGTFTVDENSRQSASNTLNMAAQTPCPQNKTLDLPSSNVNSPKVESNVKEQTSSILNTTKTSPVINQSHSAAKESDSCDVRNATFDRHSLHKSGGNTILGEAGAATFCLQNNTFDAKSPSKQNGTITLSETSSSDSLHNAVDVRPGPVVCNATSSPKHSDSEVHPPELLKHKETTASTNSDSKTANTPESTFEANPAAEVASGAGRRETKDHSQSGLPMTDGLSDTLGNQSVDAENSKANTLNLDDTLDLRADYLVTSTPMTNCKMFNFHTEREEGKILAAQKKLYDGLSKPDGQTPSDIPSNIVCDRKTFLTQPAVKSLLPPSKVASQLLKYKPASTLPGRIEPLTSGLPMTRQRTQAEALRNTAASEAPQVTTGISSSYNLRTTATGSKQPTSGLRKPQTSGIPSGIQRPAMGLRPPSTRSNALASSSTDALRGPTVTNPPAKISQAKKHPLTRSEALPVAKKKKIDAPLTSSSAEVSTSACDANKAKNLKRPATSQKALPAKIQRDDAAVPASNSTGVSALCDAVSKARALKCPTASHKPLLVEPQSHGCPKCVALEEQLELKSKEIRRLKEELLKYSKPEEES